VELTCPRCGNTLRVADSVEGKWLTCPRCLASVRNPNADRVATAPSGGQVQPLPRPPYQGPSIERDTRGDTATTGLLLILLGLAGCVGYVWLACSGAFAPTSFEGFQNLTLGVGFTLVVLVIIGIVLGARGRNARPLASGLLGGLTIGLTVGGLLFLLAVAFVIYAINDCLNTCGNPSRPPARRSP
jgi:hypothetical protein